MQEIQKIVNEWIKNCTIKPIALYGFGSCFNNSSNATSDIDLAWYGSAPLENQLRWQFQEELACLLKKNVDLVDLLSCHNVFRFQIISSSSLLYCNDKTKCAVFETYVYSSYLRFQEERKEILKDIQKRGSVYG